MFRDGDDETREIKQGRWDDRALVVELLSTRTIRGRINLNMLLLTLGVVDRCRGDLAAGVDYGQSTELLKLKAECVLIFSSCVEC